MIYNIVLVCQNGASTAILVEKMLAAAQKKNIEIVINAYPESKLGIVIDEADLVLLAPQIRHKRKAILERYGNKGITFLNIEPQDYGMMNGEKVLNQVLETLGKEES